MGVKITHRNADNTFQQHAGDPYIYLRILQEWYCYNPNEKPLGGGAMGDVYFGYRVMTKSPIAVKRVKDAYANNRQIRERARQEASLAFRHPNLVEMLGCCEYDAQSCTGPIWILSNFVKGENIDEFIQKNLASDPARIEKICSAIKSVLDALEYIHSKGVIHRDIKPSNIMIENGNNARLMDLGISRMNGGNKFSSYGFIGTPEYSAPEQIKRQEGNTGDPINATTDIYELGITFYELLDGKNPMLDTSESGTLAKQINETLPASPRIPDKLMKVIWKATEKSQAKRYQTAREFRDAIDEALMPDKPWWTGVSEWMQRNIIGIMLGIVALGVIIFIIALMTM